VNIKKHLLLCATPTKQKCFKGNEGQKTWECLKKTLKKENFSDSTLDLLDGINFNPKVIEYDRKQPEFKLTFEKYLQ